MRFAILIGLLLLVGQSTRVQAADRSPIQPSFLMDQEPAERAQEAAFFLNPALLPLWKLAIAQPQSEMQRQTSEAITLAHKYGHSGLEVFLPDLVAILEREGTHPATRFAAAHALTKMDYRESATTLFEVSQKDGPDLRHLVEPVLARWSYEPIQAIWGARLKNQSTSRRDLLLAINGLSHNRVAAFHADLLTIAIDPDRPVDVRLAAARAAGETAEVGLEPATRQLIARGEKQVIERLCAASFLVRHRSTESVELNQKLAIDSEPAVCGIALRTLFASDPQLVLPIAEASLNSRDANVRRIAIEAYLLLPTVERLETLSAKLNDPHPDLRGLVREGFFTHSSEAAFEAVIRESTIRTLNGDNWRGQEQAALLLAALNRPEVTPRLIELLNSDRDEVMIATGWSLRILAVPSTAPAMTAHLKRQSQRESMLLPGVDSQVAHLCEALGKFKYKPAASVMMVYVPKTMKFGPTSRSAAIWGLGQIYEDAAGVSAEKVAAGATEKNAVSKATDLLGLTDKPEPEVVENLANQLMGRVREASGMPPEWAEVRRTSALALGRMKAVSQLSGLKAMIGDRVDSEPVDLAMRWAVLRISGKDLPITLPGPVERTGWFLEPAPTSLLEQPAAP